MVRELLQGVLDYVRLKMLAVPGGVQTAPLPAEATNAQLAERVNQLTAALDAMLKTELIQGTRLLVQEGLLDAPDPRPAMQSAGLPIGEMTSQERFEFFRPRILPPEPSDETPEDVSTVAGSAGTGEDYSRADHVHGGSPAPATATPTTIASGGGAVGTSAKYAKEDHAHPYTPPTAAPDPYGELPEGVVGIGYDSAGSSDDYSRGDHKHALPYSDPLYMTGSPGNLTVRTGDGLTVDGGSGDLVAVVGDGLYMVNHVIVVKLEENSSLDYGGEGGLKVAPGSALYSFPYKDQDGNTRYIYLDSNHVIVDWDQSSAP